MTDVGEAFVVKAIQNYKAKKKGELSFKKENLIQVTKEDGMLYFGSYNGKEGWFPYFYVKRTGMTVQAPADADGEGTQATSSLKESSKGKDKLKKSKADKKKHKVPAPEGVVGDQYVLKSGMLGKQSGSKWKPRWIVLRSTSLMYFKSAVDTKTLGKVSTKAMRGTGIEAIVGSGENKYAFYVTTSSKKKLVFSAPSIEERDEWTKMIDFARMGGKPIAVAQLMTLDVEPEQKQPEPDTKLRLKPRSKEDSDLRANKRISCIMGDDSKGGGKVLKPKAGDLRLIQEELSAAGGGAGQRASLMKLQSLTDDLTLEEAENVGPEVRGIGRVRAKHDYVGRSGTELSFQENDEWLLVEKKEENGWWLGERNGVVGHFSSAYVEVIETFAQGKKVKGTRTSALSAVPRSQSPKPGSTSGSARKATAPHLLGNFQLGEAIGHGAFGHVYRGINVITGEMVAIKQLELSELNQADLKATMAELELLKVLDHPNIVQYKTFIKTETHLNIVLEFVEGGSLASIVSKFGTVPDVLAIRYVKQILQGLVYLHSKDVIHRDIKCGNILITKDGTVKLADFGIATRLGDAEAVVTGSPYWMAPEIIQLRTCTPAADIWALGATMIELRTGNPPYMELNKMQAMFRIVEDEEAPIPEGISSVMRSFLEQCFKKDPAMRSRASELLEHSLLRSGGDVHQESEDDDSAGSSSTGLTPSREQQADALADLEAAVSQYDVPAESEEEEEEEEEVDADEEVAQAERETEELLGWFTGALDKGHVPHAIRIRKAVRDRLKELKQNRADPRYKELIKSVRDAMDRCEDEMGEHIPIDSDDSDDEFYSSDDSSGLFEEDEADSGFDFRL